MIQGINSAKKYFFLWLFVFLILFFGLAIGLTKWNETFPVAEQATKDQMNLLYGASFIIACLPIGWSTRRRFMYWYAHVPTEEIKITETNLVVALFRLIKCSVLTALDIALFAFYFVVSVILGPFMNLYAFITGLIYMLTGKI